MLESLDQLFYTKLFWITAVIVGFYVYLKYAVFNYWNKKGVPHEPPLIPFGNALPSFLAQVTIGNLIKQTYEKFRQHRFYGIYIFYHPILVINDPELIRQVLIKDFNTFHDRGLYYNEEIDPSTAQLFFLPGARWKKLRTKLSPIFTSGKLKQMFPFIKEIGDELINLCYKEIEECNVIEWKSLMGRYTADTISSTVFGLNCNSLTNPKNEFTRHLRMVFDVSPIKTTVLFIPKILEIFRIPFNPRKASMFFEKVFEDVVNHRRENNIVRKDFVNLLMQLMDKGLVVEEHDKTQIKESSTDSNIDKMTLREAQAQAFVFLVAGYETTSSTITYCLYELALNPDIQDRVHEEIDEVFERSKELTYDLVLHEFEYLQMALNETLRKHPSLPFLNRLCAEDIKIPDSNYTIDKNTPIMICVSGLHRDPDIFPDPDKFDPERFSKENIAKRNPYVYLPFGDGPRSCIGNRFGILQSKVALISVLKNFKFSICDQTPIPINYSKRSNNVQAPGAGVYLTVDKRIKH